MKILYTTYYHAFQNPGGGEVVLLKSKMALEKLGVNIELFNPWNHKIKDFDLIHNFSSLNYRDWDGFKTYCPKLVVTPVMWPDDSVTTCLKEKFKAQLKEIIGMKSSEVNFWNALKKVDHFFPTSNQESERIQKRYELSESKFSTIYNGIELPTFNKNGNSFVEKYKIQDFFLFVGRISPLKNVNLIIKASIETGNKIVLIGDSDINDKDYHNQLINLYKNNSSVKFIGPLASNSQELNDAYYACKGLIVASQFETCSLVGLEAGIRGVPVFMTNKGATIEVYGDYVDYIDPDQPDSLMNAISKTWSQDKKNALQNHIQKNYQWENIAKSLKDHYQEIIKR